MSSLVGRFGCPTRLAYRVDCLLNPYSCQHSTSWCSWKQTPWTASVMGAVGSGGHGRASRSTTPNRRLACGDLAGGQGRRHPTLRHHTTTSSRGQQALGRRAQTPRAASVGGAVGPGGHGRASRSTTPNRRLACGDLAGGRARRHPTLRHHTKQQHQTAANKRSAAGPEGIRHSGSTHRHVHVP